MSDNKASLDYKKEMTVLELPEQVPILEENGMPLLSSSKATSIHQSMCGNCFQNVSACWRVVLSAVICTAMITVGVYAGIDTIAGSKPQEDNGDKKVVCSGSPHDTQETKVFTNIVDRNWKPDFALEEWTGEKLKGPFSFDQIVKVLKSSHEITQLALAHDEHYLCDDVENNDTDKRIYLNNLKELKIINFPTCYRMLERISNLFVMPKLESLSVYSKRLTAGNIEHLHKIIANSKTTLRTLHLGIDHFDAPLLNAGIKTKITKVVIEVNSNRRFPQTLLGVLNFPAVFPYLKSLSMTGFRISFKSSRYLVSMPSITAMKINII